jgi:hypothetical protein
VTAAIRTTFDAEEHPRPFAELREIARRAVVDLLATARPDETKLFELWFRKAVRRALSEMVRAGELTKLTAFVSRPSRRFGRAAVPLAAWCRPGHEAVTLSLGEVVHIQSGRGATYRTHCFGEQVNATRGLS